MYDFLRRPAWIVSHVLVALAVVAMIGLGFWQRQRWIDERAKSDALAEQAASTPVPLDDVLGDAGVSPTTPPAAVPESVEFRRVEVTGTYDAAGEVLVRNRSQGGAPGAWVLTPLVQGDGTAVAVVRGWVPLDVDPPAPPFPGSEPPEGQVTVTGLVQRSQQQGTFGGTDPEEGTLRTLARVDVPRLDQQVDAGFEPVYVVLDGQAPPQPASTGGLPEPVKIDVPTPETNFSYMIQWWIFATIAVVGYPLVLRRVARNRARGDQTPDDDAEPVPSPAGAGDAADRG
ncbi:SURF1 family protein [Dermatobacter hominis]|uniref:SURF1 family protein n=1 Tax=Dermatobacter hominis TaxID=2884263 RepID=UPI001D124E8E|nr:SURF1 family protein [Dermatobacter hominis]UDY36839.1 SURF1 family protein [Dermatobacter hominis]